MARYTGNLINNNFTYLDVTHTQNAAGNTSTISWVLGWAFRSPTLDRDLNNGDVVIDGSVRYNVTGRLYSFSNNFTTRDLAIASGSYTVTHNSAGYKTVSLSASITPFQNAASSLSASLTLPRIPKPPSAPSITSISNVTSSSARINGTTPTDDGGAAILDYQFQAATNTAFTSGVVTTTGSSSTLEIGGLTPGQSYYFRMRAQNSLGFSPYSSGTPSAFVGLPAPTFTSWQQNTQGQLVGNWTAPTPATGLTGYRLQLARDAGFTTGVQNIELGNITSHAVPGLAGGRTWHARVAARTAGGTNAYSAGRSQLLILSAGDLDSWTSIGTPPAAVSRYTSEGIRRGTIENRQALFTESLATAAATLPANTFGIQHTVTGLSVGKAYRYSASAQLADPSAKAVRYQLRVTAEGSAPAVTITTNSTTLGLFEFVADSTSAILQIMLADAVTTAVAVDVFEAVAFTQISLLELATDYPVRLRSTVYESNLANHFDLACNSVGASWYVAKDGVTQFRLPGSALPVSALFSDEAAPGALHYVDVNASYDTRGMVNRLDVTNYGVSADGTTELNENLIVVAQPSIDTYGVRSSRLEVNLWGVAPYDASLSQRMAELLVDAAEPRLFVSSFRWNAQQNPAAANDLEVGQRITVQFKGTAQDSQIVHLQHEITPRRWIITVTVRGL
jgi:hypothetical protein